MSVVHLQVTCSGFYSLPRKLTLKKEKSLPQCILNSTNKRKNTPRQLINNMLENTNLTTLQSVEYFMIQFFIWVVERKD